MEENEKIKKLFVDDSYSFSLIRNLLMIKYMIYICLCEYKKPNTTKSIFNNNIIKKKLFLKKNLKIIKQRRYYRCSNFNLGGDKFFNIVNITSRILSKALTNSQLKQIPVVDKKEVMQSLNHYHVELEGTFKLQNNNEEHTAFIGITHSRSHDVIDKNNEPFKLDSFFVEKQNEDYINIGPEIRIIKKDEINKTKLYEKKNKFNFNREKMEDVMNSNLKEEKVIYLEGYKDNKMKEGLISKFEKDGEKIFKISEIENTDIVSNLDKINKII